MIARVLFSDAEIIGHKQTEQASPVGVIFPLGKAGDEALQPLAKFVHLINLLPVFDEVFRISLPNLH